jgi:hypothetical protein
MITFNEVLSLELQISKRWSWSRILGLLSWRIGIRNENCDILGRICSNINWNRNCQKVIEIEKEFKFCYIKERQIDDRKPSNVKKRIGSVHILIVK